MITLQYTPDGLGNLMFQYCFARMLAEKTGQELVAQPINGFPHTADCVTGQRITSPTITVMCSESNPAQFESLCSFSNDHGYTLKGFFQNFSSYPADRKKIQQWFELPQVKDTYSIYANDLVLHIRLGDYIQHGIALSINYYDLLLQKIKYDRLFIVTATPKHPFIHKFKKYQPIIVSNKMEILDFQFLKQFSKMVLPASTFSWWAAYLSDHATEVYWPMPQRGLQQSYLPGMRRNIQEFTTIYHVSEWGKWKFLQQRDPREKHTWVTIDQLARTPAQQIRPLLAFHTQSNYLIMN